MEIYEKGIQQNPDALETTNAVAKAFAPYRADIEEIAISGYSILVNVNVRGYEYFESSYPPAWQDEYEKRRYYAFDPVLVWSLFSTGDKQWSEVPIPDLRRFMNSAKKHGLVYGAAFSRKTGANRSLLSVSRPDRELLPQEMMFLSGLATEFFESLEDGRGLSKGEIAVLQCLSEDKNVKEASEHLGISESAAKERLASARRKVGCKTNYQLVATALRKNLIR